ncbi:MAG: DUF87 domain-containing protein [Anaerolineales bacterium]|nr:DUF87 domain-containing protein [Anaerolineales bacterium]
MDTKGNYYLGRLVDGNTNKTTDAPLLYEPEDLTTHAFVVGMTGSGKTGLCIDLLEEAALNDLPALMIDPKGDITNVLLHFPELLPEDFKPWIDPDQARRADQTIDEAAQQTAETWKKGLADWDITPERLKALKDSVQFAIFTPGSDSGLPVSILASLEAPEIPWEANREILRERISSTVTALLGLVGLTDIDPVRSREHILLSNVFEHAWSSGQDLDLSELILQTQNPPFEKLGVFDVDTFFSQKDRFALSMLLNNILAAPAFQSWIQGLPLDIPSLLYTPEGKPRHSVFYIAHLSESERMFFVTLLFSAVETWMRSQSGATSLRTLLYFDEIFGYLPPVKNPPSKQPILRMLKQARAFGVGLVLVTQNPVDVDYKGISNTGSWFIGKLQTDQDKQRLLDGLESAVSAGLNRAAYDRMISGLGKRVFLLHNVHNKEPLLMQTRWAMNYLAGPLSRSQIPPLNTLAGAVIETAPATPPPRAAQTAAPAGDVSSPAAPPAPAAAQTSTTRPAIPAGVNEYFLPNNQTISEALKAASLQGPLEPLGLVYRPVVLAQARTLFLNRKYNLNYELPQTALVGDPGPAGVMRWEDYSAAPLDPRRLDNQPAPQARFSALNAALSDARALAAMQKDFSEWAFRSGKVTLRANEALKIYGGPDVSQADFRKQCADAARDGRDAEIMKRSAEIDRKIATIQERLRREQRELEQDESKHNQRKMEEMGSAADTLLSIFNKRSSNRRISSSLSKRRMTETARAEVEESKKAIADFDKQIAALEQEKTAALAEVQERWGQLAGQIEEISLAPLKKDVFVELFGVAWYPYHLIQTEGRTIELPAYQNA